MSIIKETLSGEFERGKPWNPRKSPDDPNPLYGEAVKWSQGSTAHGDADFLSVRDDDGVLWSILVGTYKLKKALLEGELSEWDDDRGEYVVTDVFGPVEPGELVAIEYKGEREFTNKDGRRVTSPDFRTLRKPANPTSTPEPREPAEDEQSRAENQSDDEIPF